MVTTANVAYLWGFYFIVIVVLFIFVIQYSGNFDSRNFGFVHGGPKLMRMMRRWRLMMMMMMTTIIVIKSLVARCRGYFGCDV